MPQKSHIVSKVKIRLLLPSHSPGCGPTVGPFCFGPVLGPGFNTDQLFSLSYHRTEVQQLKMYDRHVKHTDSHHSLYQLAGFYHSIYIVYTFVAQ